MTEAPGNAGPLAGLRVVELAGIGPVPFACGSLRELGAQVLRIDRPDTDPAALAPPADQDGPSLCLDLKTVSGRDRALDVIDRADVLVEGMRPGVTERLGVGPDACLERNPRLVYARMTGWGQHGPLAHSPGHDITYAAVTGALHAIGTEDKPVPALNLVADFGGGAMYLLVGILAALHERRTSGRGQVLDVAMVDGVTSLLGVVHQRLGSGLWDDHRRANLLDGGAPFYDTYRCADGRFVAVGAIEEQFYSSLVATLGVADRLSGDRFDRSRWEEHRQVFTEAFGARSRDDWVEVFAGTDACVAPVLSLTEAPRHPHLAARGTFVEVDGTPRPAPAPRFSRSTTRTAVGGPVPDRTEDLLAAWGVLTQATGAGGHPHRQEAVYARPTGRCRLDLD
jgi:alpha-methylacyl-CoA racemase